MILRHSLALAALCAASFGLISQSVIDVDILTQHNDSNRTGANLHEKQLTPANINELNFGKLFDLPVDGQVQAQPLYLSALAIGGKTRNVLIVATEHNTLYAFDADTGESIWQKNFGQPAGTPNGQWPIFWWDAPYHDLTPEIGITSTPAIDRVRGAIYFTTFTEDKNSDGSPYWRHWLHAVSLVDPTKELYGGPVDIQGSGVLANASYGEGRHVHSDTGGVPTAVFTPSQQLQRTAVLLAQGRVVLAFGSHADSVPYQGWVFSYNEDDLTKTPGAWLSAERELSGIWQSGMGLTSDGADGVFLITGNGFFDGKQDFGDSIVRLKIQGDTITTNGYFAPCNQNCMRTTDQDLGSSGMLHIPGTTLFLGGGKQGRLYLLDGAHLPSTPPSASANCLTCTDAIVQRFQASCGQHIHGSPIFYQSAKRGPVAYVWAEDDHLRAFPFDAKTRHFASQPCPPAPAPAPAVPVVVTMPHAPAPLKSAAPPVVTWTVGKKMSPEVNMGMTGGMLSLSADGNKNGIVWATTPLNNDANPRAVHGVFRAYDADDLTRELWNSTMNPDRDDFGNYAKFTPPTVANGKVYVATFSGRVAVYGLNPPPNKLHGPELLANGDFETSTDTAWQATGLARMENQWQYPCQGPYTGMQYGALYPTDSATAAYEQVITVPANGNYVLKAHAATNISAAFTVGKALGAQLGVNVATTALTADVRPDAGYQYYELRFAASAGQQVHVWFRAPQMNWSSPGFLLRARGACYPTAHLEFDPVQPQRSFVKNQFSAWAAIDRVSLTQER